MRGPSQCTVRVIPEKKLLAVSVYAGGADSVRGLAADGKTLSSGGENMDFSIQLASADVPEKVARWADVRSVYPPICGGDVYVKLNSGRLMRGVVSQASANGVLVAVAGRNGVWNDPEFRDRMLMPVKRRADGNNSPSGSKPMYRISSARAHGAGLNTSPTVK